MSTWCLKLLYLSLKIIVVYALSACEALEDTTMVSIIRISKKNRQHNNQKEINKKTNNDLQNIHMIPKIEYHEPP